MLGKSFDEITAQDAHDYVAEAVPGWYKENRRFAGVSDTLDEEIEPDHWQDGDGFLAPLPPKSDPTHSLLFDALKKMFVAEDVIGDVLTRRCNGVLGKSPHWSLEEEVEEESQLFEEGSAMMRKWWDDKNVLAVLKSFVNGISFGSRSMLRVYVPPGRFHDRAIQTSNVEESLEHIFIEHVTRDRGTLYLDRESMRHVGMVIFEEEEHEIPTDPNRQGHKRLLSAEICYYDSQRELTVFKMVEDSADHDHEEFLVDLDGDLLHYEGQHRLLINDSIRRNQKDLNTTRTQARINNDNAAFPQRIFINLQPPGSMVTDQTGKEVFQVGVYNRGPGQDLYNIGIEERDADGNITYKQGGVEHIPPVDNENLVRSAEVARLAIYRQCKQLHIAITDDATASGESRAQAQSDYLLDLMDMKGVVDDAGRWIINVVWKLAHALASQTPPEGVKVVFDCRINPGHMTSVMRQSIIEQQEKGIISRATAMSVLGVEDIEAEKKRIQDEQVEFLDPVGRANLDRVSEAAVREREISDSIRARLEAGDVA